VDESCVTLGYSIIGDIASDREGKYERIHDIMKKVADRNDLKFNKDVKLLTIGQSLDLKNYFESHLNMT
jgi:hypothetical protein